MMVVSVSSALLKVANLSQGASDDHAAEAEPLGEPLPDGDDQPVKSPIDDMGDIFASAFDELENESEDSEDGSGASDTDNYDSDASDQSELTKKRKRITESAENTEGEESDAPINGNSNVGSNLQRRKRKAFERISSLTQNIVVSETLTPSEPTLEPTSKALPNGGSADEVTNFAEGTDDENDAAFSAAFEQELEAQLAAGLEDGEADAT